jgi:uncharacterized protein
VTSGPCTESGRRRERSQAIAKDSPNFALTLTPPLTWAGGPRTGAGCPRPGASVDNYTNGFAVQSFAYTTPFDAQEAAPRIRVPFLLVHSEHALAPPLAREFYASVRRPKSELWLESQGQIDFYDDLRLIDPAADAIAEHFTNAVT